jgi:hypothetical protein
VHSCRSSAARSLKGEERAVEVSLVRSLATPARGLPLAPPTAASAAVRLSLRVGVPPGSHMAGSNGVVFELAGEPHAVTTAL